MITSTKPFIPVFTLSINHNINFLGNIKQVFKRTISWNKYRSEITTQTKNSNLDYLIDATFRKINRLFVLSFKNGNYDPTRDSLDKYFISLLEIKDFNAWTNNKPVFDQPVKNKQESHEKLTQISKNDDYTTGNLLDYLYNQKHYKIIGIDLSKQTNTSIPRQVNFVGISEDDDDATTFFVSEKNYSNFFYLLIVTE